MSLTHRLADLRRDGGRGVLFTVVDGPRAGDKALVVEDGETVGAAPDEALAHFDEVVRGGRNRLLELPDGTKVFRRVVRPSASPLRLRGGGHRRGPLPGRAATRLEGHRGRRARAFLTPERIPSADQLVHAWPDEALAEVAPDHQTAVVVLTHDDKFDEPALMGALATEAFYVGALGSRRNQERRRERLLEAGVDEEALERIHGPSGLDIGADTQEETALSIMAEILAVRANRSGGPLKAKQRIHAGSTAAGLSAPTVPALSDHGSAARAGAATARAPQGGAPANVPTATPCSRECRGRAAASGTPPCARRVPVDVTTTTSCAPAAGDVVDGVGGVLRGRACIGVDDDLDAAPDQASPSAPPRPWVPGRARPAREDDHVGRRAELGCVGEPRRADGCSPGRGAVRVARGRRRRGSRGGGAASREEERADHSEHELHRLRPAQLRLAAGPLAHVDRYLLDEEAGLGQADQALDLGAPLV